MINITKENVLSGESIFTVQNGKGEQYTYRVEQSETQSKRPTLYFARVITANDKSPVYLGIIDKKDGSVKFTKASKFSNTSKEYLVLAWALKQVWDQRTLPQGYSILDGRATV